MTIVQIASDLHIEHSTNENPEPQDYITPVAKVLILAGDIGSLYKIDQLRKFLEKLSNLFQVILYIPGNHEFYTVAQHKTLSYKALEARLQSLESIPNLHILNRSSVRIKDVCLVGCTLWSEPKCVVPPFIVRVQGLNTASYKRRHQEDLRYIKKMMKYCKSRNYKMIVITHHPPSYQALQGIKKNKKFESLYATNLDYLLHRKQTKLWIRGHTHKNIDFISDGGCRVVSNQKGKPKDHVKDYSKSFHVSL